MITDISQLDLNGRYSYADYKTWNLRERVELIMGKIFRMTPAPREDHQRISTALVGEFYNFLKGRKCNVYSAPFDVRFPEENKSEDGEIKTVVQPDICVICDQKKIDERGCKGAPDLIVEIVSENSVKKDLHEKFDLYERSGVHEYWIVHPVDKTLIIYYLDKHGKYQPSRLFTSGDIVHSRSLPGLTLSLDVIFQNLSKEPEEEYKIKEIRLDP